MEVESAMQHPWPATRVTFSPGDRWIVSVLSTGAVVPNLWRTEDLIASTCRWVLRPVRESERPPYSSRTLARNSSTLGTKRQSVGLPARSVQLSVAIFSHQW
jgi:hypothetical protein